MSPSETRPSKTFLPLIFALSLIGLIVSLISLQHHLQLGLEVSSEPSFCNISEAINCDAVNGSAWSSVFGIPIAGYGATFYLALIFLSLIAGRRFGIEDYRAQRIFLGWSVVASIISVLLFCVSKFIIGSLCLLCIVLYLVNFAILGATLFFNRFDSFIKSSALGIIDTLSLIGSIVGLASATFLQRITRLLLLIVVGLVFFFVGIVPRLMLERHASEKQRLVQIENTALESWLKAPVSTAVSSGSGPLQEDFSEGSLTAPIQIVEFADVECPHCRIFYQDLHEVLKAYDGKYRFIFRNYPIDNACNVRIKEERHRFACLGAEFARCAGEQMKFFNALEFLFDYQGFSANRSVIDVKKELVSAAGTLNLDNQALTECLESGRQMPKIRSDIADGETLGLTGTPAVWINGRFSGARSAEGLKAIFNYILAQSDRD